MYSESKKEYRTGQEREGTDPDSIGKHAGAATGNDHAGRRTSDIFMQEVRKNRTQTGRGYVLVVLLELRGDAILGVNSHKKSVSLE